MRLFHSPITSLFILLSIPNPILSAKSSATSFCKCICFNNSTIIALNPPPSSSQSPSLHNLDIRSPDTDPDSFDSYPEPDSGPVTRREPADSTRPHHKPTCADCTRAFCLDYNLPICKNARDEDVFTTCFQRDSLKDEAVVVIFVFATAGLLAWALVKPWIDRLRERSTFIPLPQHESPRPSNNNITNKPQRRTGPGLDTGTGSGIGGGRGERHFPTDMHAEQGTADIVSGIGSGSGSASRPLS
ncbi:uncharacterized protein Z518_08350 [Rhinocladiella mackenziei CBS 650.93]|uniref:Uncharacterized protein n=1 Tax=Rhinocladiella mackenziei CBS 650.93 TaxID=1442369 RepID=A0A0D2I9A6_9EURO|nr:uncharacterized protein Z518_08350 [Rhinocladiella mackenziei CBS 650.93]KIX02409.1 hypothetical protein Z518_08350 [Rhinocladiella mackenziei CBS 650.93]